MYVVRWEGQALNELATAWAQATSEQRRNITAASQRIDFLLKGHPEQMGESRPLGRRILFVPPLGVTFHINEQTATVSILHVWRFRQRGA